MTPAPILVNKKTAAGMLGISVGMISKLIRTKQLEVVRIGARALLRREDIEQLALKPSQRRALGRECVSRVQ
jgi:excisionase family DNA binding protein